ncbi:MAG: hypothetical protein FJX20_04525 [Alphaproteobacteria bacterium]|nr:hypothetical protein [Alphaproteobacteria bacterium]
MLKLFKAMVTTGGAGIAGLFFGLIANKIFAVTLGPAGVGLLATYRQVHDIATGLGIFGAGAGQIQALSSVEGEVRRRRVVASIWLSLCGAVLTALTLLLTAPLIAEHIFRDRSPDIVLGVRCLALTVGIAIVGVTLQGLINVSRAIGRLAIVQVLGSLTLALIAWPLAQLAAGGHQLAFIGFVLLPIVAQFAAASWYIHRLGWMAPVLEAFTRRPERADMAHQLRFFAAGLSAGALSALCFMAMRALLVETGGQELHGLFQAAWTLALQNVGLLMTAATTYLLPTMASAASAEERSRTVNDAVEMLALCSIPLIGGALLFQPLILELLFSSRFLPALDALTWMLIGNYFRVFQALFFNVVVSAARVRVMMITEIAWYGGFSGLVVLALSPHAPPWLTDLNGIGIAFAVVQIATMLGGLWYIRTALGVSLTARTQAIWLGGLAMIVICAAATWHDRSTNWQVSVPLALLALVAPIAFAGPRRWNEVRAVVSGWRGRD